MSAGLTYELVEGVATLTLDDGKANAMSRSMLRAVNDALDQAQREDAIVVLRARGEVFCGGFDLATINKRNLSTIAMVREGFRLSARLLAYPRPTLVVCQGHALAMGAFLVLSADFRLGVDGPLKIGANEVEIGLTMPHAAMRLLEHRLNPSHLHRSTLLSERYDAHEALAAGFLDKLVPADALEDELQAQVERARGLNARAFKETKARAHGKTARAIRRASERDRLGLLLMGARQMVWGR